jgi:predicted RND superfamily exporter protein
MSSFFNSLIGWCERQIIRCPWTLLLLSLLLCGATLAYTLKNLAINTNTAEMLSPDLPFQQNQAHLNQAFLQDANTLIFVVQTKTPEENPQSADKLVEQLSRANDRFDSTYIPTDNVFLRQQTLFYLNQNNLDNLAKKLTDAQPFINHLAQNYHLEGLLPFTIERLRSSLTTIPFGLDDLPQEITSHWVSAAGLYRILITPEKDQNRSVNLKEFVTQVQAVDNTVSDLPIFNQAGGDIVVDAFIKAFSGAFIAIVVLLLLMYRSIKKTLLVIMPLLLAALLTGASNVLLDNPFNFANIIALPLLLGIGIDSSILIMHRHHSSSGEDENLLQSNTTRGIIFSSITTLCSFSSLAFTAHRGMASMSLVLAIGLTFTVMCSLIVLPAFSGKRI